MQRDSNVVTFGGAAESGTATSRTDRTALVSVCRSSFERSLRQLTQDFFESVDDTLYDHADKAGSEESQASYFDAMREVRKQRATLETKFNNTLLNSWDRFWQLGGQARMSSSAGAPTNGLSLMDEDELDEELAITNMVAKGVNRFQGELYALNQRFGQLCRKGELDNDGNPAGPKSVCEAFKVAVESLSLDLTSKLIVYKMFDKFVLDGLAGTYDDLNDVLVKAGVLPQLVTKTRRRNNGSTNAAASQSDQEKAEAELAAARQAAGVFNSIQQMLVAQRGAGGVEQPANAVESSQPDVLNALTAMQVALPVAVDGAILPLASEFKAGIVGQLQVGQPADQPRIMRSADEDVIDVVAMLFDFILEDRNLPDAIKAMVSRLQIPIIKVAMVDKQFFGQRKHPARRLLNELAKAGVGWVEGPEGQALYDQVDYTVSEILENYGEDPGMFAELLEEFLDFSERELSDSRNIENRLRQVARGKEQLETSRTRVATEIDKRLRDCEVPAAVYNVLVDAWKDVLLLIHLRQGPRSPAWREALKLADKLLWSVMPKQSQAERENLMRLIPVLLKALREGLTNISYEPHRMETMFRELQACHLVCLRGGDPLRMRPEDLAPPVEEEAGGVTVSELTAVEEFEQFGECTVDAAAAEAADLQISVIAEGIVAPPVLESMRDEVDDESLRASADGQEGDSVVMMSLDEPAVEDVNSEDLDDHDRQVRALAIGAWVEFAKPSGLRQRAKVAWKSDSTGNLVFVNRQGAKLAEKTRDEMADELRDGRATVLDELPLMDRALDSMIQALARADAAH